MLSAGGEVVDDLHPLAVCPLGGPGAVVLHRDRQSGLGHSGLGKQGQRQAGCGAHQFCWCRNTSPSRLTVSSFCTLLTSSQFPPRRAQMSLERS